MAFNTRLWNMAMGGAIGAAAGFKLALAACDQLRTLPECAEYVDSSPRMRGHVIIAEFEDPGCYKKLTTMDWPDLVAIGHAKYYDLRTESLSPFWTTTLIIAGTLTGAAIGAAAGAIYGHQRAEAEREQNHHNP
jgi:gas vesicle protein